MPNPIEANVLLLAKLTVTVVLNLGLDQTPFMKIGRNMAGGHSEGEVNTLLHIATISGVLASLMRHFRASLSSLPLLSQPISNLPIGSWSPDAQLPNLDSNFSEVGSPCPV